MVIPFQNRRAPAGSPAVDAIRWTARAANASVVGGAIQPRTSGPDGPLWLSPNQTVAPTASRPTAGRYDRRVPFPLINKPTPQPAPESEPHEHLTVPVPRTGRAVVRWAIPAGRGYLPGPARKLLDAAGKRAGRGQPANDLRRRACGLGSGAVPVRHRGANRPSTGERTNPAASLR